jgi:hypothetical protein
MSPQLHSLRRRILFACIVPMVLVFTLLGLVRQVAFGNPAPSQSVGRNDKSGTSTHVTQSLSPGPADRPALTVTPNSLDNNNSHCTGASTWVCKVVVSTSSSHNIHWQASGPAAFNPQGGTVPPGAKVTISNLPCPARETFVFSGTATKGDRVIPVSITWTCSLPPSPTRAGGTPIPSLTSATPTPGPTATSSSASLSTPQHFSTPTVTAGFAPASSSTIPPGGHIPANSQALSSLFTIAAFILALAAFMLYLIIPRQQSSSSLLLKALTLILPKSVLRRLGDR